MAKHTKKHPLYCQPINLPVNLGCTIPEFLKKNNIPFIDGEPGHWRLWREYFPTEFIQWFHNHQVQVKYAEVFVIPPGGHLAIHSDARYLGSNLTKLNIVEGDDTAQMAWYSMIDKDKSLPMEDFTIVESKYLRLDDDNAKLEFMTPITQPSLVNVGAFHNVYNITNNKKTRYCVSMVLSSLKPDGDDNELMQFQNAVTIFKEFLYE